MVIMIFFSHRLMTLKEIYHLKLTFFDRIYFYLYKLFQDLANKILNEALKKD